MFGHLESPPSTLFLVKHASQRLHACCAVWRMAYRRTSSFRPQKSRLIWTLLIGPNLFYLVKCVLEAAARLFLWMFSTVFQYEDTTNVKPLSRMRKSLSIHWHLLFENSSVFSKFLFGDGYLMGHNSFRFVFIILPTL